MEEFEHPLSTACPTPDADEGSSKGREEKGVNRVISVKAGPARDKKNFIIAGLVVLVVALLATVGALAAAYRNNKATTAATNDSGEGGDADGAGAPPPSSSGGTGILPSSSSSYLAISDKCGFFEVSEANPDADCPFPYSYGSRHCCDSDCCGSVHDKCESDNSLFGPDCVTTCNTCTLPSTCAQPGGCSLPADCGCTERCGDRYNCGAIRSNCLEAVTFADTGRLEQEWKQIKGTAGDGPGDYAGSVVALSGDGRTMATIHQRTDPDQSVVRVQRYDCTLWMRLGADLPAGPRDFVDGAGNIDVNRRLALSADGNTVVVGSPNGNGGAGFVSVFDLVGGEWQERTPIAAGQEQEPEEVGEGFSVATSADGTVVAVASRSFSSHQGRVRVFRFDGKAWNKLGDDLVGRVAGNNFGYSIDISSDGEVLAVGAPFTSEGRTVSIYRYLEKGGGWSKVGYDLGGFSDTIDNGYSVALSADGTVVAMSAPYRSEPCEYCKGFVQVFRLSDGAQQWSRMGGIVQNVHYIPGVSVDLSADGKVLIFTGERTFLAPRYKGGVAPARRYSETEDEWVYVTPNESRDVSWFGGVSSGRGEYNMYIRPVTSAALSDDGLVAVVGLPEQDDDSSERYAPYDNIGSCKVWVHESKLI